MKIGIKIFLFIGLVITLSLSLVIYSITFKSSAIVEKLALSAASKTAGECGNILKAEVEVALNASRTLAQALAGIKSRNIKLERETVIEMLKRILEENPSFIGTYTCWEPEAFDGLDSSYINKAGYDASGRFIPYVVKNKAGITIEPLVDYEVVGAGDYYLKSKKSKNEVIIEPYIYKIDGRDALITSVVAPIIINGVFTGIVGVDISIETLHEIISKIKPYETGYAYLVSNGGILASYPDGKYIGKNISSVINENETTFKVTDKIKEGNSFDFKTVNNGNDLRTLFVPFTVGKTNTPWNVALVLEEKKMLSEVHSLRNVAITIGIISLILIFYIIWLISRNISFTISQILFECKKITDSASKGDFSKRGDFEKLNIEFKPIIEGLNMTLDKVTDKIYWFEQLLDAIPFPISVTGPDMKWTFINKPVEQLLGVKRNDMVGKQCNNWNANICKTENCGVEKLRKGIGQTIFAQAGMNFQVNTSTLKA